MDYTYAVAYTRTLENKMLSKNDMELLINCEDLESAIKFLSDKGYGNGKEYSKSNMVDMLKDEIKKSWSEVEFAVNNDRIIDIFLYRNDFHNLKTVLKAVFSNVDWEPFVLEPCIVPVKVLFDAISVKDYNKLPEFLREPAINAYKLLAKTQDGQLMEILLDKSQFSVLKKAALNLKSEFLINFIDLNASIVNMKIALRAAKNNQRHTLLKEAFVPCNGINSSKLLEAVNHGYTEVVNVIEHSGYIDASQAAAESMESFEKWCDNRQIEELKSVKNKPFGIEPILSFLVGKRYEIMCVRLILSGLANGAKKDLIRERLRELYV